LTTKGWQAPLRAIARGAFLSAAHEAISKEAIMKLTPALVQRTLGQFEARVLPDDHPVVPELNKLFGDHTFFLDGDGLHIVEPAELTARGAKVGRVVKLASWHDANRTSLAPHRPQPTDVVVDLKTAA
jgi:hypothetical protein